MIYVPCILLGKLIFNPINEEYSQAWVQVISGQSQGLSQISERAGPSACTYN